MKTSSSTNLINELSPQDKASLEETCELDDDQKLMMRYVDGDAEAFEHLYEKHKGGLYRYCNRMLKESTIAEECFQEIWLKVINNRQKYHPKAKFTTYLYRVAHNHIIDTFRINKKLKEECELDENDSASNIDKTQPDITEQIENENQHKMLRKNIESLPNDQRNALLLKLDAGLSLEEIAHILDCGKETIKSRLRYATNKLRDLLGESR